MQNSPLRLVNRNFMQAVDWRIPQAVVQNAGQHANSQVVDTIIEDEVAIIESANLVKCTLSPVPVVEMRLRCHLSHEATNPCIAVIVTRHREVGARATNDRAGNIHDRSYSESWWFVWVCTQTFQAQGTGSWDPIRSTTSQALWESSSSAKTQSRSSTPQTASRSLIRSSSRVVRSAGKSS